MLVLNASEYDGAVDLIEDAVRVRHSFGRSMSAKQLEYREGLREGTLMGLAAIANERRCRLYPKFKALDLPGLMRTEMIPFYESWTKQFISVNEAVYEGKDANEKRRAALTEVRRLCSAAFYRIVNSEDLQQAEVDRHRNAVLAREEPPTEADREWLEARAEEARRQNEELISILGNKGRIND